MFASGVAVWRCWQAAGGPLPTVLAGHSLGEYSALTAAGVFAYEDAMGLVAERARLMGNAVPAGVGGMAAIMGLDDESVAAVCADIHGERVVQAVNFNAPGQVVISGHLDAVEQATEAAKAKGARRAMVLPVSVPNHSALMDVAAEPLAARIASTPVTSADMRVIQNLEARSYDTLEDMLGALKRHVNNPVYWTGSVQAIKAAGVELVVEMGPGKVLTGLTKRIDKSLTGVCVQDPDSLDHAISLATAEHS
jgi:[acyl-carrier-protein] S-malonyltransferase